MAWAWMLSYKIEGKIDVIMAWAWTLSQWNSIVMGRKMAWTWMPSQLDSVQSHCDNDYGLGMDALVIGYARAQTKAVLVRVYV